MTLEELQEQKKNLLNEVALINKQIEERSIEAFVERNGFKIGDKVQWMCANRIITGEISGYDTFIASAPRYKAKPFKKDGSVGNKEVIIWRTDSIQPLTDK